MAGDGHGWNSVGRSTRKKRNIDMDNAQRKDSCNFPEGFPIMACRLVQIVLSICCRATLCHPNIEWSHYIYVGLPKCLFLVLLIIRNSLCAASYLDFETMTSLNSLKSCILSFTFEAVAKACSKC